MNEIEKAAMTMVTRLIRDAREIPVEVLQTLIKKLEDVESKLGKSDAVSSIFLDGVKGCRLVIQWSNQAREQMLNDGEKEAAVKEALPDMLRRMMPDFPDFPPL